MYGSIVNFTFTDKYDNMAGMYESFAFAANPEWRDSELLQDPEYRDSWTDEKRHEFYYGNKNVIPKDTTLQEGSDFSKRWYTIVKRNQMRMFQGEKDQATYETQKTAVINRYHAAGKIANATINDVWNYLMPLTGTVITVKEMEFDNDVYEDLMSSVIIANKCLKWIKTEKTSIHAEYQELVNGGNFANEIQPDAAAIKATFCSELKRTVAEYNADAVSYTEADTHDLESYRFDNSYMVFDTTTDNLFPALKSTFIAATT